MAAKNAVTDEVLGRYARKESVLFRRVREGTLPIEKVLSAMQGIIEGNFDHAFRPSGWFIDCSVPAWCSNTWTIHPEDQLPGAIHDEQFLFDPEKLELYLDEGQQDDKVIHGELLKERLEDKPVLPANVLDHLLANTAMIPETWKGKYVNFWGTVYCYVDGSLGVRYLFWDDGRWRWRFYPIARGFRSGHPAVLPAR